MRRGFSMGTALLLVALSAAASAQTVSHIVVKGNERISDAVILATVRVKVGSTPTESDLRKEEDSLMNLGVFKSVKLVVAQSASGTGNDLVINVVEYPVVKEYRITGNTLVTTEEIIKAISPLQEINKVWNNKNADQISQTIRAMYEKKGMLVEFTQIGPDADSPNSLTIAILEPRIGTITFTGLHRTKPETIKRIMKSKPGGPLRRDLLRKDLEDLALGTNWFEQNDGVVPELTVGDAPGTTDVKLKFKEARTGQYQVGLALDPQSHLVGTVDIGDSNWRGLGQSVGLNLSQATVGGGPSAEASFNNRFYDAKDTSMSLRVYSKVVYNFTGNGLSVDSSSTTDTYDERRTGISLSFSRPLGEAHGVQLGFQARTSKTIELNTSSTSQFIQQDGDLYSIQIGGQYNTVRGGADPYRGDALSMMLEPGVSNITKVGGNLAGANELLGRSNFVRLTGEYKHYWSREPKAPKNEDNTTRIELIQRPTVAFRARFGAISGTVPFFEQLFVGGTDSLRGYDNQRFWGNRSFLTTLEYRHPIQKAFSLAAFADYGSAWGGYGQLNNFEQSDKPQFKLGYGLGLGFKIQALGSIRIDFAFNQEGSSRTHFSFGQSF
ncbi:MAG: BamA/TamA family outer membrane protein [Armatimonadota bacterium]